MLYVAIAQERGGGLHTMICDSKVQALDEALELLNFLGPQNFNYVEFYKESNEGEKTLVEFWAGPYLLAGR